MKTNAMALLCMILFLMVGCRQESNDYHLIHAQFDVPESADWVLVINPSACKGCLDILFSQIYEANLSRGALLIISPSSKTYLSNPHLSQLDIPILFDTKRFLIADGLFDVSDELILLKSDKSQKFSTDDWTSLQENLD